MMMQPTKAMYDTVGSFMGSAKKVQIDSVFEFNVSISDESGLIIGCAESL
jgi:hypothetical protein